MKKILSSIVFVLVVVSCKKDPLPDPKVNDPVFTFEGEFKGEPITRQAGNDDYYMYSSHIHDNASGLYIYYADLKKRTCPSICDYALTVKINDSKITLAGEAMDPSSALVPGPYLLNDISKTPFTQKINLVPERKYVAETYVWKIIGPDSVPSTDSYSLAPELKLGGTYTVDVAFNDNIGACQTNFRTFYRVGSDFQPEIEMDSLSIDKYKFTPKITRTGSFIYSWDFGDGTTLTEKEPTHQYVNDATHNVKLTVTDGSEVAGTCRQVGSCHANFRFQPQPLDYTKLFKTITFELLDKSGNLYTSDGVVQPQSSYATVIKVEDYEKNERDEKTKKITLEFTCLMQGPDGVFPFTKGKATIAVSYK